VAVDEYNAHLLCPTVSTLHRCHLQGGTVSLFHCPTRSPIAHSYVQTKKQHRGKQNRIGRESGGRNKERRYMSKMRSYIPSKGDSRESKNFNFNLTYS
jgi:hypothetical protein